MKNILIILVLMMGAFGVVKAQYYYDRTKNPDKIVVQKTSTGRDFDHFFYFSWDLNKPLSNDKFISNSSNTGTKFGFRKRLNEEDKLWVGGDFGWAVYKQYVPTQTYTVGTQSLTTDLYNYTYNYSLVANIDYFFLPMKGLFVPYAGLGIGGSYVKFAQYYNIYGTTGDSWGVMIRPEAGILLGFKESSPWRIKAAYHYDYSSNTNSDFNYKNFMNTGIQVGIVKMAW